MKILMIQVIVAFAALAMALIEVAQATDLTCVPDGNIEGLGAPYYVEGATIDIGPEGLTLCNSVDRLVLLSLYTAGERSPDVLVSGIGDSAQMVPVWPEGTVTGDQQPIIVEACPPEGGQCATLNMVATFRDGDVLPPISPRARSSP